jgi:glycine cleavage system aminomethyltransferase T
MAFDPNTVIKQYGDPADEVRACRTDSALFDFSFVARGRLQGSGALAAIGHLTGRPLHDLIPGQIRYAVRESPHGWLAADLTIWRHDDSSFEIMSGRPEDIADLIGAAPAGCTAEDLSAVSSTLAVQGPGSLAALSEFTDVSAISKLSYFTFAKVKIAHVPCIVGRLGYTGEPGFEIVLPRATAKEVWRLLAQRVPPAGFAAADILRIEAGFVLFANEFRVAVTAREAGLERFAGPRRAPADPEITLVCFQATARERPVLWQPRKPVARPAEPGTIAVTSACHSADAGGTLGLGFALRSDVDTRAPLRDPDAIFTDIRLVSRPFFDPHKRRPRAAWAIGSRCLGYI